MEKIKLLVHWSNGWLCSLEGQSRKGRCMYSNCGSNAVIVGENVTLMEYKVRWVILKGLPSGDLGVVNIYAPNIFRE